MTKEFIKLITIILIYCGIVLSIIAGVNYTVDASSIIRPQYTQMAKLALAGNTVATPQNYNERIYQICVVKNFKQIPETVVIGSSRGMYVGEEVTGYKNLYNNCVSGACLEDYYALLGLYFSEFHTMPQRVIIETSPWVFYTDNPEGRWRENDIYHNDACMFFEEVNGVPLTDKRNTTVENPYISLSYFRYNIDQWKEQGNKIFKDDARISYDSTEAADLPDGTIRYPASDENESEERLHKVLSARGAVTYEGSNNMKEIDKEKALRYESLVDYLQGHGTEVVIFMQPFSPTQCRYSFDEGLNPGFFASYDYVINLAKEKNIKVRGGYDSRIFNLSDKQFIDSLHLDRNGTRIVWNYK